MRKAIIPLGFCFLIIIAFVLSYSGKTKSKSVKTILAKNGRIIDFVKVIGRVEAVEDAIIRAKVNARIEKVLVEEGQAVKAGQQIIRFDTTDSENAVKRARLKLVEAEMHIQEIKMKLDASERTYSDPSEVELYLKGKEDRYNQAIINRDSAKRDFNISQDLYNLQAESLISLKNKEDSFKKAEIDLMQAERELKEARDLFSKREKTKINQNTLIFDYEIAAKQKDMAQIELDLVISQLNQLELTSPINGKVVLKEVKNGMVVSAGQPLVTIADTEQLQVRAEVDEADGGRIKKGQEVIIRSEAIPDKEFHGYIDKISSQAFIKGERTVIEVIILIDEHTDLLMISNQVDVKIITGKKDAVLSLPLSVIHRGSNPFIWLYQDGVAHKREVGTGLSDMDLIEITHGLKEGDEVIADSNIDLRDGEEVVR